MLVDDFELTCRALLRSFFSAVLELVVKTLLNDAAFIVDDVSRICRDVTNYGDRVEQAGQSILRRLDNVFDGYLSRDFNGLSVEVNNKESLSFNVLQVGNFYSWAVVRDVIPDFLRLAQSLRCPFLLRDYYRLIRSFKLPASLNCSFNGYQECFETELDLFERNYSDNSVAVEYAVDYIHSALSLSSESAAD